MPRSRSPVAALINQLAPRYGLDANAVRAVAQGEGGLDWGAVGDQGTSFGPFQLHVGGALPRGKGAAWANSPAGLEYALRTMSNSGARGLTGEAAVNAIVRRFERPANPDASVRNAVARLGSSPAGTIPPPINAPQTPAQAPPQAQQGVSPLLAQVFASNNQLLGVQGPDLGALTSRRASKVATQPEGLPPVVREFRGKQSPLTNKVLNLAKEYLGTPYSWGGGGPGGPSKGIGRGANTVGFDCSGFIEFLYARHGIETGGVTYTQWQRGKPVDIKGLQAGDAVFFNMGAQGPEHVGLYIGRGQFMHAPRTGDVVKISKLTDGSYRQSFVGGRRYI